jgi:hypothetical protein
MFSEKYWTIFHALSTKICFVADAQDGSKGSSCENRGYLTDLKQDLRIFLREWRKYVILSEAKDLCEKWHRY